MSFLVPRTEPLYIVFGNTKKRKIGSPDLLFLMTWHHDLNNWLVLGAHETHWSFITWDSSTMVNENHRVYSFPVDLWEGLRYYQSELGKPRGSFFSLTRLWQFIILRMKVPMKSLYNAEMLTRILRASGIAMLPGRKTETITPSILEEAVCQTEGVKISIRRDIDEV
jgi:hypothetical protein